MGGSGARAGDHTADLGRRAGDRRQRETAADLDEDRARRVARFLRAHKAWIRSLVTRTFSPEPLMRDLEPLFSDPAANIAGLHVFTFNELERTERWRQRLMVPC